MQPLLGFCMQPLMVFYVPPLLGLHQLRYSALFVFVGFIFLEPIYLSQFINMIIILWVLPFEQISLSWYMWLCHLICVSECILYFICYYLQIHALSFGLQICIDHFRGRYIIWCIFLCYQSFIFLSPPKTGNTMYISHFICYGGAIGT